MAQPIHHPLPSATNMVKVNKSQQPTHSVSPILSLFAGGVAGGVEATITYPTEFLKTRSQLKSSAGPQGILETLRAIVKTEGISGLYTGCSTLAIGTAMKAGVRFLTFDTIKGKLMDSNGKLSGANGVIAGMSAGAVESIAVVTPTERLKTALIDDAKNAKRFRNSRHAISLLVQEQGFRGLYKGLASTTMKQSATSGVRMGSYNFLKELSKTRQIPQNTATTFGMGACAGIITVYATQPFDTVKTRTQSASGESTLAAARGVLTEAGVLGFWKGSTMRLSRLIFSGGIVFSVYEQIVALAGSRK
ncbi:related to CTP1-Mitochondrial citrate transporter-member of the mitochondrial carrier (MCF) family [Rhynchosporium secalis]|uniref:Related to CTP1-Mitochondrial citrate transporter-member of the mitochondrial carrier (MCF) family n=1 Tax=Rhynchosporium secalis TaxID=38038 RepID=A0A1E1MU71_RHYSE|nr:related to CTP1-Mitochondrial citrate transporter-member of the mitochondrial carrier (MCF) family [Rhynchosporium secalis]